MSDDEIIDDATIDEPEAETDAAEEVETEAVEEVDATAEEADQDEPESRDSSPEKKDGTQRRIDELTRLRRQAERERDYYRQLLDDNEKDSYVPEKSLEDFDYDEKAYAKYVSDDVQQRAQQQVASRQQQEVQNRRMAEFAELETTFADKHDDYYQATRTMQLTPEMLEVVQSSEKSPEVLYYLAKNPDVNARLHDMHPIAAAKEIGRIEVEKLAPPPPSTTKAPEPVPKIKAGNPKVTKDPSEMSDSEFAAWRRRQIARR